VRDRCHSMYPEQYGQSSRPGEHLTAADEQHTDPQAHPSQPGPDDRDSVSVGVVLCDLAGHILHVDDPATAFMGLDPGTPGPERVRAWPAFEASLLTDEGAPLPHDRRPLRLAVETAQAVPDQTVAIPDAEGKPSLWLQVTVQPLGESDGAASGFVVVLIDITHRKLTAAAVPDLFAQPITPAAERATVDDRLRDLLTSSPGDAAGAAVIVLSIDRFKNARDSLGQALTEQLETMVVERLRRTLRDNDAVVRTGEGDFVLLLAGTGSATDVAKTVERLRGTFDRRWELTGHEIYLTASTGIAIYPDDGDGAETLLQNAREAMRGAQAAGGNTWQFFHESMDTASAERLGMETALHRALELGHFILDYQPQIDSYTGNVVAVEALVRWKDPEQGIIPPGQFIPLAEETGLMLPIGEWVLETACQQATEWNLDPDSGVRMSVNISPRQFAQQDIIGMIRRVLAETGLPAPMLEVEITESMAIQDPERSIALLHGLKQLGVRIALDDFGTGYSSLSHLARLPVDTVKIDRSFVMNLEEAHEHVVVATSIIALGHRLGLTVVAEGVETREQAGFLGAESCDLLQGFLFSRPVSAEKCSDLIGGESAFATLLEEAGERLAQLMSRGGFGSR
jgi:polar amino acid transport system substrate-binding protein